MKTPMPLNIEAMRYNPRTFGRANGGGAAQKHDPPLHPKRGDKPCFSWYAGMVKDKPAMILDWDTTLRLSRGLKPDGLESLLQKEPGTLMTEQQNGTTIYFRYM